MDPPKGLAKLQSENSGIRNRMARHLQSLNTFQTTEGDSEKPERKSWSLPPSQDSSSAESLVVKGAAHRLRFLIHQGKRELLWRASPADMAFAKSEFQAEAKSPCPTFPRCSRLYKEPRVQVSPSEPARPDPFR